ncbi:uncharacterized protein PG986_006426 [Apiospora aurea]|uniref:Uncharacterized protein n=1 Tax=Apiospora aurea TaxID=335848 RepID=A0ABR1QKC9_9PEZI
MDTAYNPITEYIKAKHYAMAVGYTRNCKHVVFALSASPVPASNAPKDGFPIHIYYGGQAQDLPNYIPLWQYCDKRVAARVVNLVSAAHAANHAPWTKKNTKAHGTSDIKGADLSQLEAVVKAELTGLAPPVKAKLMPGDITCFPQRPIKRKEALTEADKRAITATDKHLGRLQGYLYHKHTKPAHTVGERFPRSADLMYKTIVHIDHCAWAHLPHDKSIATLANRGNLKSELNQDYPSATITYPETRGDHWLAAPGGGGRGGTKEEQIVALEDEVVCLDKAINDLESRATEAVKKVPFYTEKRNKNTPGHADALPDDDIDDALVSHYTKQINNAHTKQADYEQQAATKRLERNEKQKQIATLQAELDKQKKKKDEKSKIPNHSVHVSDVLVEADVAAILGKFSDKRLTDNFTPRITYDYFIINVFETG